jgi:hypothetical protein
MKYIIAFIIVSWWIIPVNLAESINVIFTVCSGAIIGAALGMGLVFLFLKALKIIRFIILRS